MKKITEKFTTPIEADFYSIENLGGDKWIHINGYTYKRDGDEWGCVEVCWFRLPLYVFIHEYNLRGYDFVEEIYETRKQAQSNMSTELMTDCCNKYFNGKPADAFLAFSELTTETPVGNYMNEN